MHKDTSCAQSGGGDVCGLHHNGGCGDRRRRTEGIEGCMVQPLPPPPHPSARCWPRPTLLSAATLQSLDAPLQFALPCMHACCCSVACTCCAELRCAQITGRTYALLCVHGRQFSALLHSCCACCWPNAAAAATWLTIACMHGGRSAQRMYANAHLSQMLRATQPSCKRTAAAVAVTRRHHMQGAAAQQHVCELGETLHST